MSLFLSSPSCYPYKMQSPQHGKLNRNGILDNHPQVLFFYVNTINITLLNRGQLTKWWGEEP